MTDAIIGLTFDRSGSMASMWDEAVAGYNTFKNDQVKQEGSTWLITTYFDNEIKTGYFGKLIDNVPDLAVNDSEIHPRGMTALVDATINTINKTEQWLKNNPNFDGKVFQVIITDGMENASEAQPSTLKQIVENKESAGWEFIYLAANVDLDSTRRQFGFGQGQSMSYTNDTVMGAYGAASSAITRSRTGGTSVFTDKERSKVSQ